MGLIKKEVSNLKSTDIYSLLLFALFKIRDIPEYAALSELVYILDKKSLLKLCEYFGGMTISIPTIEELESLVYSLILYEYVDIEHKDYEESIKIIGHKSKDLRKVKSDYIELKKILDTYNFSERRT